MTQSPTTPSDAPFQSWLSSLWYEGGFWASITGFTLGFSLRTEGMHHIPRKGPALLIANHQSYLDPILIGIAARRHLCYLARKSLFDHPAMARLLRSFNGVPIDQEGLGIAGLRTILHHLRTGQAVVVFPEGERTSNGAIVPLKPGIQLLVQRARAPILPVGIAGAYDAWPRWRLLPVPSPIFLPAGIGTIAVSIGPPLDAKRFLDMPREQLLGELWVELQKTAARAERLRRKDR